MKHPHCNRSHASHLFWCRGFAPVVFILAIALIVVAIGSGVYFALYDDVQAPRVEDVGVTMPATTTEATIATEATTTALKDALPTKPKAVQFFNCGSDPKTANQCIADHVYSCTPAAGTVVDPDTGLTVERIVDGYRGAACSYRTNIVSGKGDFALLAGMDINCMLPKSTLSTIMQEGAMTQADMFTYCTGSFIDLMREQRGASGQ